MKLTRRVNLVRYRDLLRRRWWVLLITIALAIGIQSYLLQTAPPTFVSIGRMILNLRSSGNGDGFTEEHNYFLGTQMSLMVSSRVLERAGKRIRQLHGNLVPVPVRLELSVSPKTIIFNLQAIGAEPEYTRVYLDACMEEYLNLKTELRSSASESTLDHITQQLISLDRDLKRHEEEELAFKTNNNLVFIKEQVSSIASYLVQKIACWIPTAMNFNSCPCSPSNKTSSASNTRTPCPLRDPIVNPATLPSTS